MSPPSDDSPLFTAIVAAASIAAVATPGNAATSDADKRKALQGARSQVTLGDQGVVLNIPGLAEKMRRDPQVALRELRKYEPTLQARDVTLVNGFVRVASPAFRRRIVTIGDTNPSCNVNCVGGGCT
ncbi:MAG: hypothetical protein ACTHJR_12465 [Sphingomonas sp.]|uniref:hypothetical protein n=1 Tax=Sphingomonas sp. TaxID=28214 RepID=UPI003F7D631F